MAKRRAQLIRLHALKSCPSKKLHKDHLFKTQSKVSAIVYVTEGILMIKLGILAFLESYLC